MNDDKETRVHETAGREAASAKELEARSVVNRYMLGAIAVGLIPAPVFDVAAIAGVQLKMLHSLSRLYGIPFSDNAGKSVIASLVGGLGATSLATGTFGSLVKIIPVVGPVAGAVTMPVLAGASTYAVGMVFIQHFEAGGTFLDFDPAKVKEHFASLYKEGKKIAHEAKDKVRSEDRKSD